jgi:hypothetical protein
MTSEFNSDAGILTRHYATKGRPPCGVSTSYFSGTHIATAHPDVSLVDIRIGVANRMLASLPDVSTQYRGLAMLLALNPSEDACPILDAVPTVTASVCAWRAVGGVVNERSDSTLPFLSYLLNMVIQRVLSPYTTPTPVLRPGPRALAATGGVLPAELRPHVVARVLRQALLLAKDTVTADGLCRSLLDLWIADWCDTILPPPGRQTPLWEGSLWRQWRQHRPQLFGDF